MGHRKSVHVVKREHFESPPSPNSTIDQISADIRVFFPPNADFASVVFLLTDAYDEVKLDLRRMYSA